MQLAEQWSCGTSDEQRAVERWEKAGWEFLYCTEVPRALAVLENPIGDTIFIDDKGWAWKGPAFSRSNRVPLEQCPPVNQQD